MTVLPNAPIDDATGLPVPTIAVATDGGVSVIKDDGTVVDIRRTFDDDVHHISLDGDNNVYGVRCDLCCNIPSADWKLIVPGCLWFSGGNTSGTDHPAYSIWCWCQI